MNLVKFIASLTDENLVKNACSRESFPQLKIAGKNPDIAAYTKQKAIDTKANNKISVLQPVLSSEYLEDECCTMR